MTIARLTLAALMTIAAFLFPGCTAATDMNDDAAGWSRQDYQQGHRERAKYRRATEVGAYGRKY